MKRYRYTIEASGIIELNDDNGGIAPQHIIDEIFRNISDGDQQYLCLETDSRLVDRVTEKEFKNGKHM